MPRIKLVLEEFGKVLGRKILRSSKTGVLYAGKYLFYADMIAFRELVSIPGDSAMAIRLIQLCRANLYCCATQCSQLLGSFLTASE